MKNTNEKIIKTLKDLIDKLESDKIEIDDFSCRESINIRNYVNVCIDISGYLKKES